MTSTSRAVRGALLFQEKRKYRQIRQTVDNVANSFLRLAREVMKLLGHLFKLLGNANEVIHRHRKQNATQDKRDRNGEIKNYLRKYKCCFHTRILHHEHPKPKLAETVGFEPTRPLRA